MSDMRVGIRIEAEVEQARQALDRIGGQLRELGSAAAASSARVSTLAEQIDQRLGVGAGVRRTREEIDAWGRALDQLRARYNPVFAVVRRYREALSDIRRAHQVGAISTTEMANAISRERRAALASIAALKGRGQALQAMGRQGKLATGQIGNLAAQFNDIGVMLAAGQSPLQLAIQQGTQITQVIGPMGAGGAVKALGSAFMSLLNPVNLVTLGVIAGGAALVQWLTQAGEEARSLEEALSDVGGALKEWERLTDRAATPISRLRLEFGDAAGRAQELYEVMARIARLDALDAAAEAAARLADIFGGGWLRGGLQGYLAQLEGFDAMERSGVHPDDLAGVRARALEKLREEYGVTREEAERLAAALDDLARARGPEAVAASSRVLSAIFDDIETRAGHIPDQLREAVLAAAELEQATIRLRAAEDGVTQSRRAAEEEAQKLLETLRRESALADMIAQFGADSAAVERERALQASETFRARVAEMEISEGLKQQLIDAWEAARGIGAVDIRSGIAEAAAEARRLAEELGISLATARSLAAQARAQAAAGLDAFGGYGDWKQGMPQVIRPPRASPGPARGGGSARGTRTETFADLAREADRALDRLGLAVAAVDEKVRAGLIGAAEGQEAVRRATASAADAIAGLIPRLERAAEAAGPAAADKIAELRTALRQLSGDLGDVAQDMSRTFSSSFERSFADFITGAKSAAQAFRDFGSAVLAEIARIVSRRFTARFITPLIDSLLSVMPFARGGVVGGLGGLAGQVVDRPVAFAMPDGGLGVMGEAGAEAILPLRAGPQGDGVLAIGPDGREGVLALTRGSRGDLGVQVPLADAGPTFFAKGGIVGRINAPGRPAAPPPGRAEAEIVPVTVNVTNTVAGTEARVEERRGADGGRMVEIMIERIEAGIAANARRGVGPLADLLATSYGLGRAVR